jgi:hypothetical protein
MVAQAICLKKILHKAASYRLVSVDFWVGGWIFPHRPPTGGSWQQRCKLPPGDAGGGDGVRSKSRQRRDGITICQ